MHSASINLVEREKADSAPTTGAIHRTPGRLRQKKNQPRREDGDIMVVGQEPFLKGRGGSMVCQAVGTLAMIRLAEG
ncbi:MAG TPA: hypothetical protein DD643_00380 [Synechococcus sp. UBA8638]|nr:hypothetical protein [Synechococcus sp. UBA8638]